MDFAAIDTLSLMKILWTLLLFGLYFQAVNADEPIIKTLAESRSEIVFKSMSNDEKLRIINIAKTIFSKVYVNLEHKMKLYQVDPIRELATIEENYQSMNEIQFNSAMLAVFTNVKDLHTNYFFPKPVACYEAIYGDTYK